MPGGHAPRPHTAVLERRQQAATLYLQGEQQYAIARRLGVSQQQISCDLQAMRAMWLASLLRDFDAAKSIELAKIDHTELCYWDGWKKSQEPHEVSVKEAKDTAKGRESKASVRTEGQAGDPRFLDGVLKCVERRCAILGLDAPQRYLIDWEHLSETQLARLAQGEAPAQVMAEA